MKITLSESLNYVPASHEDPKNPGVLKKVLLNKGDICPGEVQMVNWAFLDIGKSFQLHYHQDMDEVFVFIAGTVEAEINGNKFTLSKGDSILISANEQHKMTNIGEIPVEYIVFGVSKGQNGKTIVLE
jgi:mannose-6-phosphate isomerase-like protein (cupin superfamily)